MIITQGLGYSGSGTVLTLPITVTIEKQDIIGSVAQIEVTGVVDE